MGTVVRSSSSSSSSMDASVDVRSSCCCRRRTRHSQHQFSTPAHTAYARRMPPSSIQQYDVTSSAFAMGNSRWSVDVVIAKRAMSRSRSCTSVNTARRTPTYTTSRQFRRNSCATDASTVGGGAGTTAGAASSFVRQIQEPSLVLGISPKAR